MRMYDPRVGRFFSSDPLKWDYAYYTPYQFAGNKPISATDLDGMEEDPVNPGIPTKIPDQGTTVYDNKPPGTDDKGKMEDGSQVYNYHSYGGGGSGGFHYWISTATTDDVSGNPTKQGGETGKPKETEKPKDPEIPKPIEPKKPEIKHPHDDCDNVSYPNTKVPLGSSNNSKPFAYRDLAWVPGRAILLQSSIPILQAVATAAPNTAITTNMPTINNAISKDCSMISKPTITTSVICFQMKTTNTQAAFGATITQREQIVRSQLILMGVPSGNIITVPALYQQQPQFMHGNVNQTDFTIRTRIDRTMYMNSVVTCHNQPCK